MSNTAFELELEGLLRERKTNEVLNIDAAHYAFVSDDDDLGLGKEEEQEQMSFIPVNQLSPRIYDHKQIH